MNAFNPCIVIPVYNHARGLQSMLDKLRQQGLPCLLVDDGSNAACAAALDDIAGREPWITLLRRPRNGGKGAAVCEGLREAYRLGYSHGLQVDADGQHNLDDVAAFLAAGREAPAAVITGVRVYDRVPASRRYGRYVTDVWVWINTLSLSIKDSMCGYRLYPLAETLVLLDKVQVGRRMDFDTDILVRLYWQGLEVRQIHSRVLYHEDIVSHFDLWKDNLRISGMHAKLFFGMLIRLPRLLARKRDPHR